MKKRNKILIVTGIFILGIMLIISMIFGLIKLEQYKYDEALKNKPTYNYVEESMEEILISTSLYVYDDEIEADYIIYYIEDVVSGLRYKVLWVLQKRGSGLGMDYWKWGYKSYVRIN